MYVVRLGLKFTICLRERWPHLVTLWPLYRELPTKVREMKVAPEELGGGGGGGAARNSYRSTQHSRCVNLVLAKVNAYNLR